MEEKFVQFGLNFEYLDKIVNDLKNATDGKIVIPIEDKDGVDVKAELDRANKSNNHEYYFRGVFLEGEYEGKSFEIFTSNPRTVIIIKL